MSISLKNIARLLGAVNTLALAFFVIPAGAQTYAIPSNGNNLIGHMEYVASNSGATLVDIAQHFDLGLNEIEDANPAINPLSILPAGIPIQVPTSRLLPPLPHSGIVINLPEMRMYYYPATSHGVVMTYPIGIGRIGKTIPIARTAVVRKTIDPVWIPTENIRAFNKEQGITLPKVMPAGPDNPLGPYAIYLKIPTYLIHSTIFPDSVGRRASFGCIRMIENDIKDFFPLVTAGTNVTIIDMPNKIGWQGHSLYLESHTPLEEHSHEPYAGIDGIVNTIANTPHHTKVFVDWQLVAYLAESRDGIPHEIGFRVQ